MFKSIYRVIPESFRRRAMFVAVTIFVRALLNFVGIAMLVPVLMIIVGGDVEANPYMSKAYEWLGLSADGFVAVVCGMVVGVLVLKNVLNQLLYRAERSYIFSLYKYISRRLYVSYYQRGLGFIKRSNSAHLARDVNAVSLMFATGVLKPLAQIVGEIMLLIIFLTALVLYSPYLALVAVVIFVPIVLLFYVVVRRRLREVGSRENEVQRAKNRIVAETYRGYVDVKIGGAMPYMLRSFDDMMTEIVDLRNRHASISMLPQAFIEIGVVVGLVAMAIWGHSSNTDMQLMFGIFVVAAIRLLPVVRNIMSAWSTLRFNLYSVDTLKDIDINDCSDEILSTTERIELKRSIELDDVSFRFDDADSDTLSHFSLKISRGERVGIRGASGVGKTTLFNIILGLYRPTTGSIMVDDTELTDENVALWQNSIGYVSQNVFITDSTIAENIAFGVNASDIDYNLVNKVIELADLKPFVDSLLAGVNSRIGELGSRLSGGQRQRIGIARALYKQCNVLLFDEATSSLDSQTENNINSAICRLSTEQKGLTIIVIAHRESSLGYCDRIITLE
ncbi:MAG: ABC transporter ATP-binding protein [Alistipes sp.]|nr:ABC transporter ATP-binding protein [Alistipes sp.]